MSRGRILLIDDDPEFISLMQEAVEMEGYAFTGLQEAGCLASIMRDHRPDLLLLDFCLQGRNGGELCYFIREELQLSLPVVLLSAYPEAQLPLSRIPYSVFVPKPFDIWALMSCLNELMRSTNDE